MYTELKTCVFLNLQNYDDMVAYSQLSKRTRQIKLAIYQIIKTTEALGREIDLNYLERRPGALL